MTNYRIFANTAVQGGPVLRTGRYAHALAYAHVADVEHADLLRHRGLQGIAYVGEKHPARRYVVTQIDAAWNSQTKEGRASRDEADALRRATLLDEAAATQERAALGLPSDKVGTP